MSRPALRYDLAGDAPDAVEVLLLGAPLELMVSAQEHHDGLMREFRLLAMSGHLAGTGAPARLMELTEILGNQYASAQGQREQDVDAALSRGEQRIDLAFVVSRDVVPSVRALDALMAEADEYCAAEQLMSLERSPEVKRFAAWYLDQFVVQCAGGEPVRWSA